MGLFGWSYPPGCNSVPGDEADPPCPKCGKTIDGKDDPCTCPECPECGECGCMTHMPDNELIASLERLEYMLETHRHELEKREKARQFPCKECGTMVVPSLRSDWYDTCPGCKKSVDRKGNVLEEV